MSGGFDLDILEADLKANRTGWQRFKTIFPGIKDSMKKGDLETIDRTIRHETTNQIHQALDPVAKKSASMKNNLRAGDILEGLTSLNNNIQRLINSINNASFGWSTVGGRLTMNMDTMRKLLKHDNGLIDIAAQISEKAMSLSVAPDAEIMNIINEINQIIYKMDQALNERTKVSKGLAQIEDLDLPSIY